MLMRNNFSLLTHKGRWLLATLTLLFTMGIGQMWADSGVIPAAASTDLGSGKTPRYVVEATGVGRLMKNKTGSSSWSLSSGKLTTGSNIFALQTYNEISSIVISATGTGNNRQFSKLEVGSATNNYADVSATGEGTIASGVAGTITITPANNIAANSYVAITLTGNINISSVELVYASGGGDTYTVTLNPGDGAYASAPTGWTKVGNNIKKDNISASTALTLPEPTRAGYKVSGWKSGSADITLSDGKLTVTQDTTLTAQWAEADCKIYSLTGEIGSALKTADNATVNDGVSLVLSNNSGRIKLTPAPGETFKAGDVIAISGTIGQTSDKDFGVYVYAENGSTELATPHVTYTTVPMAATATLSADAEYVYLKRYGGTTTTLLTCEVHRACAAGEDAELSFANASVDKLTTDADFIVTATNPNNLAVIYGSSDRSVATVNFTTGQVTIVGAGDATITAYSGLQTKGTTLYAAGTASYILHVALPPTYAVTYAAGDGEGSMTDTNSPYIEGAEVTLLANTFTAPSGKEFDAWVVTETVSGDAVSVSEGKFTMPAVAVTVTATWRAITDKYTVKYMDGETEMGTEQVIINQHPTASEIDTDKPFYSFASWQLSGSDVVLSEVTSAVKDVVITLTGRWEKVYAQDADLEGLVEASGKSADWQAYLTGKGYSFATEGDISLDSKASGKTYENWPYQGLKAKVVGAYVEGAAQAGKLITIKLGHMAAAADLKIDGTKVKEATGLDAAEPAGKLNYLYMENEGTFRYETTNAGACVLKAITIGNPYDVSFNSDGTTPSNMTFYGEGLTLPTTISGLSGKRLDHWCTDVDATIPVELDGNGKFWPTEACTLYAAYVPLYEISFEGNGATSGTMASLYAAEGDEVSVPACTFEKTGHVFDGWTYSPSVTVEEGKFTMPGQALTLTAQWEDVSKVAMVVETSTKYKTLAEAIANADAGYTVQLIQNISQEEGILIDKDLILDLNNKTLTVSTPSSTYNNRAIKVTAGTVIIKDGIVDALSTVDHNGGCYGGLRQEGGHLTCNHVTFKNYRKFGLGLKPVGGTLILNECTVISEIGGGMEMGAATAVVNNCTFTQTGTDTSNKWISTCFGLGDGANLTINGGTYTSDNYSLYIYTSGGEIDATDGNFTGDIVTTMDNVSYPSAVGTINISGGTFVGVGGDPINFTATTANDHIAISGGTFNTPIENQFCAYGYVPKDNGDGTYGVKPKEGAEIIRMDITAGSSAATIVGSGLYYKATPVSIDKSAKIKNIGQYIGFVLKDGEAFAAGDKLFVTTSTAADRGYIQYFASVDAETPLKTTTYRTEAATGIELPAEVAGLQEFYIKRTTSDGDGSWNPTITAAYVTRPLKPILTKLVINEVEATKGEGNTYSITLPKAGTNLASLDVVPTVVRNAAHATTPEAVVSNEGAWVEGANTYRVMDKDGDYTDYTITITLQGEAPAPVITTQPADVAYCASNEPTLTVVATGDELHYAWFKEAGETDEPVGEDAASYTVASAGTYYVIVTNHVDTKLDKSVTSENAVVTLNVAAAITKQPTNKRDIVSGASVTLSVEATNATGYQWFICDDAEKHNASAISGAEAANYVFNCTANAFYYCVVGNACGEDLISNVISVKLEPEGCNVLDGDLPTASPYIYDNGEWTLYAVTSAGKHDGTTRFVSNAKDFNGNTVKAIEYSRFGMTFAEDVESMTIYATSSSNERSISAIKVTTDDISTGTPSYADVTFTASVEALGKKDSSSPYRYVLEANDMLLEAGKKYWFAFSGTIDAFKICYSEALAVPVLPTLANQELCAGAAYETFDATITNEAACEGTVSYKWFSTADTENPVATTATFTPSAEGTYYVVVTHSADGHITRTVQSDELSVAHFDALSLVSYSEDVFQHMGTETTLSVVATGKNVAYVWYTCSNAAGDDAEAIDPAQTASSLTIASILEGVHYYKVVISHDCDETTLSHVFKVEGWDQLEQVDVTATTTWDMTNVSASAIDLSKAPYSCQNDRLLLANIDGVNNNASFNSQALMFEGQHIGRTGDGVKHLAGRYVQFNVTVPGAVFVTFESNGNNARTISINGKKCARTTSGTDAEDYITYALAVEPGSVEIIGYEGTSANQYVRISKIEFKAEDNYHRTVNPSYLGTLCWTNNAILGGGTLYELAGKNTFNYLVFDEVLENRLEAGKPYIFMPENGNTEIKLYNTDDAAALTQDQDSVNHMYGTITGKTLVPATDVNMYYFSANHIWAVKDFNVNITIPAYYCYVDYPAVLAGEPAAAPAPGRRRVTMGVQGEQVATGLENLKASDKPMKLIIDGNIFILRGEKMYDATGRLVK